MYNDFLSFNIGCKAHNQHYYTTVLFNVLIICIKYYIVP